VPYEQYFNWVYNRAAHSPVLSFEEVQS